MSIEQARQDAIAMQKFANKCKDNPPKGKKFKGLRFKDFKGKTNFPNTHYQWNTFGVRAIPVYEKVKSKPPRKGK